MLNILEQTLAGIVTGNHRAAAIFEKYNLDFCCKGKRTLEEACRDKFIDSTVIANELNEAAGIPDYGLMPFTKMSAEDLINYITAKHHLYVKQSMPVIQSHLQKVAVKHGDLFPYMKKVFDLFVELNEDMTQHMDKEEKILFPRLKGLEQAIRVHEKAYIQEAFISAPIQAMETEHDRAGELLFDIRRVTNNYTAPDDACTTFKVSLAELKEFERDLHEHVHLENNILFPKALLLLSFANKN